MKNQFLTQFNKNIFLLVVGNIFLYILFYSFYTLLCRISPDYEYGLCLTGNFMGYFSYLVLLFSILAVVFNTYCCFILFKFIKQTNKNSSRVISGIIFCFTLFLIYNFLDITQQKISCIANEECTYGGVLIDSPLQQRGYDK